MGDEEGTAVYRAGKWPGADTATLFNIDGDGGRIEANELCLHTASCVVGTAAALVACSSAGVPGGAGVRWDWATGTMLVSPVRPTPGPKIRRPAWVLCMSWCADVRFRETQLLDKAESPTCPAGRCLGASGAKVAVRQCLCRVFPLPSWLRHCLSLRPSGQLAGGARVQQRPRERMGEVPPPLPSSGPCHRNPRNPRNPVSLCHYVAVSSVGIHQRELAQHGPPRRRPPRSVAPEDVNPYIVFAFALFGAPPALSHADDDHEKVETSSLFVVAN